MTGKLVKSIVIAGLALTTSLMPATAGPIMDRIKAGEPIRIGFSNVPIWGFPDENGDAKGFVNEIALGILEEMGHSDVSIAVTDWAGLIPGLKAGRYDMITGGLYILNSRCRNIAFSEPIATTGDAFLVPTGNPKNITTYKDIAEQEAVLAAVAGYNTVEAAKKEGVADSQIMQVPSPTELLYAIKSGRVDVAGLTYFEANFLAETSEGTIEVTDPAALPDWTQNWVGIGFRFEDADFMEKFNAALKRHVGTAEMLASVSEYGFTEQHLPGETAADWVCENR